MARDVDNGLISEHIRIEESLQVGPTIGHPHALHTVVVWQHTTLEIVVVHVARFAPAQLGDGEHARECLIEHALARGHPLRPEISLHA